MSSNVVVSTYCNSRTRDVKYLLKATQTNTKQNLPKLITRRTCSFRKYHQPRRIKATTIVTKKRKILDPDRKLSRKVLRRKLNYENKRTINSCDLESKCRKYYLETHKWQAKRMHMDSYYGYSLPMRHKNYNFTYFKKTLKNPSRCVLHDSSYYNIIELNGNIDDIITYL